MKYIHTVTTTEEKEGQVCDVLCRHIERTCSKGRRVVNLHPLVI